MSDEANTDGRKIIHVDMDAFYASVEIRDNPSLRGKPVIVGGQPNQRGVVCAASYEARKFGVRSAMPTKTAHELCPEGVFLNPRFQRYREASQQIHQIFSAFTDNIEALALDEAWLDVTHNKLEEPMARELATQIKSRILQETGLTCSAGVSYNKFLAKLATEVNKPDGLFVIPPQHAHSFLMDLSVKKLPGVGKVTEQKMESLGIQLGSDLFQHPEAFLVEHFGKFGHSLYERIRGIDRRPVVSERVAKSISAENTFARDQLWGEALLKQLEDVVDQVWARLERKTMVGRTLTLKVKFKNFQLISRSVSLEEGFDSKTQILQVAHSKLQAVCALEFPGVPIRLIGVGLSNLEDARPKPYRQLDLFEWLKRGATHPLQ